MALTPEQEKDLIDGLAASRGMITQLEAVAKEIPTLKAALAAKDVQIAELSKGHTDLTQAGALSAFKSAYPDVPEEVFHSVPADKRDSIAKGMQEKISTKVKAASAETDPLKLWTIAGGIGPTGDAEVAAAQAESTKKIAEAKAKGDPLGMIQAKGSRVMEHLRRSIVGS